MISRHIDNLKHSLRSDGGTHRISEVYRDLVKTSVQIHVESVSGGSGAELHRIVMDACAVRIDVGHICGSVKSVPFAL